METKHESALTSANALSRGTKYRDMHGPYENFGVFNGQFEQGPSGQSENDPPEGWEWTALDAGGVFLRSTGGYAGNWCGRGGNPGAARGGALIAQKFIPVSETHMYAYQVVAQQTGNGTIHIGLDCYNAAKGLLGTTYMVAAFIPGAAWTVYGYIVAPAPRHALTANTRYVRVRLDLQMDAARAGAYVYVDDVKLQQVQYWMWEIAPQEDH
jgi:hypothetical protein